MHRLLFGIGLSAFSAACATAPATDVSGTWDWQETISTASGLACEATGQLLLAQFADNNRFTGQRSRMGTCTGAPTGFTVDGGQGLIGAQLVGSDVSFEIDFCNYVGVLTGSDEMNGTVVCPDGVGQVQEAIEGTWSASR
jgi:hypothetical protein